MADEVYDGAIGIDLGMFSHCYYLLNHSNIIIKARPTLALPTMRAPMSRSVSRTKYENMRET